MQGSHISIAPGHVQVTGDVNHTHSLPKAVQGVDVVVSALQVSIMLLPVMLPPSRLPRCCVPALRWALAAADAMFRKGISMNSGIALWPVVLHSSWSTIQVCFWMMWVTACNGALKPVSSMGTSGDVCAHKHPRRGCALPDQPAEGGTGQL